MVNFLCLVIALWNIEVVDSGSYKFTSIEINSINSPEIAYGTDIYGSDFLHYAFYDGINWNPFIVDSVVGCAISLKRKDDSLHIAYTDGTYLLFASSQNGNIWIKENTGFRPDESDGIELDVDSIGPKIVFHSHTGSNVFYGYKEGGLWVLDTVHEYSPGDAAGFCLDRQGIPHISFFSYLSPYGFTCATEQANIWVKELVAGPGLLGPVSSIAIDDTGKVFLLYWREAPNSLLFAEKVGGSWISETVRDSAYAATEGLDISQDRVFCAFYQLVNSANEILCFAERVAPNQWNIDTVDTGGPFEFSPSLELDSADNPHISYVDAYGQVKHATRITGMEEESKNYYRPDTRRRCLIDVLGRKMNAEMLNTGIYFFVTDAQVNKIVVLRKISRQTVEDQMKMGRTIFR